MAKKSKMVLLPPQKALKSDVVVFEPSNLLKCKYAFTHFCLCPVYFNTGQEIVP